ncbi:pyridoxamine 5'-phosphate oxidase family protein [Luteimonas vadosa]|uniref:Pyridoxamine 5'-phosphate oxidase family protein n=1 Tax=Luteimonas vadosa TaxID=1165507 RepID=A0ABP9DWM9_9GAMM
MNDSSTDAQREKLAKLVGTFGTAMLSTVDGGGRIVARPMTPLGDDFEGVFWFATETDNPAAEDIRARPAVHVGLMHEGDNHYVSASGRAEVVTDRAQIERLWSPALDVFFKGGKYDPNVCLLRVDVDEASYWDGPGNLLTKLAYFATVAATGKHDALSDTGTVDP